MRTVLRFTGLVLVAVLLLLAILGGGGYWYATRSLPMLDGNLVVEGLEQPAQVFRDRFGVPHIVAQSQHDLFFAQGYITAQDRLFAMDLARRRATGRLSEVLGSDTLESDRFFRTLGLLDVAEASVKTYSPAALAVGDAYAGGVNAYLAAAVKYHLLPWEFGRLGYRPQTWSFTDSILVFKEMAYESSGHWGDQLFHYYLTQKLGAKRAAELYPSYPARSPMIMGNTSTTVEIDAAEAQRLLAMAPPPSIGSNSWVVAGQRTISGKPLLANDPHVPVQAPAAWYEVHLMLAGQYNVIGVTQAGIPGVMLGHNTRIAWGASNLNADVQDLYAEKPNPADPTQFEYQGKFEPAVVHRETITVKGHGQVATAVLVTRHGPVITPVTAPEIAANHAAFSLRWTGLQPGADLEAFLIMDRSANWEEFKGGLSHLAGWSQNFVYADTGGNIAYRAAGKIPIRAKAAQGVPLAGWTGDSEWQDYIPDKDLPELYNPQNGYVAAANNKVVGDEYPYHLSDEWAAPWRATRITDLLQNAHLLSLADMANLQTDATDLEAKRYTAVLLDACRQATGGKWSDLVADARTALGEWDYVARPDSPGALVWNEFRQQLLREIFAPAMGTQLFQLFLDTGEADQSLSNLLEAYLTESESAWLDTGATSMRSLPQLAAQAFARAAEMVAAEQGSSIDKWRWDKVHRLSFKHPLGAAPLWGRLLNRGSYPAGGDTASVYATNYRLTAPFAVSTTGIWRQVVDLSDLTQSVDVLVPGESGHILSPHYLDQASLWLNGQYHTQLFKDAEIKALPPLNLLLQLP